MKNLFRFTHEIFMKKDEMHLFDKIKEIENVSDVTLIQYNGKYHG